jgi:glycosyltransferase involved in cell wall biosynthesis
MTGVQSSSLRICIFSREYPPDTGWGGIGTFAYHLAHGLVELGHEVEVISLAKGAAKELVQDGIRVHRVESSLKDDDLGLLGWAIPHTRFILNSSPAMWKKFVECHQYKRFDVVDAPELLAEGFFAALEKIVPLVIRLYTPHSKFIAEHLNNIAPAFDHHLIAIAERMAMRGADAITSPSRDLAEYVAADLNYPLERIALIPNPIDPTEFSPEGPRAIGAPALLKVLYVGRLEQRKGVQYLVQAIPDIVKAVPNVHFYIVGNDTKTAAGRKSVLAGLKRIIARGRCQRHVTFIDRVPLNDLPAFYRSADLCVVPSLYDNSPYTCLEAMSCGRPVVGTKSGGTKEYVVDGESGILVEPKSSSAIAQAVIALLTDPAKRERFGTNARERVLEKYQRKEIARRTSELYREAIARFQMGDQAYPYIRRGNILKDVDDIAASFDLMLHKFAFRESFRFRMASWARQLRMRPKLFLGEIALKVIKRVFPDECEGGRVPRAVAWLERQVLLKGSGNLSDGTRGVLNAPIER